MNGSCDSFWDPSLNDCHQKHSVVHPFLPNGWNEEMMVEAGAGAET